MNKKNQLASHLVNSSLRLQQMGLNHGATGNCSCRDGDGYLITPSGVNTQDLSEEKIVRMDFLGNITENTFNLKPSSEWRFHQDIMTQRKDAGAIVHTHSVYASTVSLFNKELPPFHYMIALVGGEDIRIAKYSLFGSKILSKNILKAIKISKRCSLP